jgi:hypothetical protein
MNFDFILLFCAENVQKKLFCVYEYVSIVEYIHSKFVKN